MKRILVLIADYGYGHHSAAIAISEALQETHGEDCVVEIVTPWMTSAPHQFCKMNR
ncbi:MAG: hypothetical protein IPJ46_21400 [Anaerolineales bacterium]|nr:hypothetical protein [Anaerolineales bacterium]